MTIGWATRCRDLSFACPVCVSRRLFFLANTANAYSPSESSTKHYSTRHNLCCLNNVVKLSSNDILKPTWSRMLSLCDHSSFHVQRTGICGSSATDITRHSVTSVVRISQSHYSLQPRRRHQTFSEGNEFLFV